MNDPIENQAQETAAAEAAIQPHPKKFNFWRIFWLSFLVVSLAWAWHDFYAPPNKVAWSANYAAAQQVSVQSGKNTILFFTGAWCSPCHIMKREVWADKQVEELVNARFTAVMIDVDDPGASATLTRYAVRYPPTTIVVGPRGEVLERVDGRMDKESFLAMLARTFTASVDSSS